MPAHFPRRARLALVGATALVIAIANPAAAPPGDLDTSFNGDGKVATDFAGTFDKANGLTIQADGKIVAAGCMHCNSGEDDFALARYNTDGSLDSSFDGDGKVTTEIGGSADGARAVAIQGDGKIVAAGRHRTAFPGTPDFSLARYNTDGSLDTSFDADGKVTTDIAGSADEAFAVAIQGDGKIVAAGTAVSGTNDFALARYNTDGSLDTTFHTDGKVTTDFVAAFDGVFAVATQGDGKIVAAGFAGVGDVFDFGLARYNADGSLDITFDADGKATTDFAGGMDQGFGISLQGDGKIVVAGFADSVSNRNFALARYNTDGSLDISFHADGKVTTDVSGGSDEARAMSIQVNGKIVVAGLSERNFALARYDTEGSLDTVFSGDGKVTTDFAGDTDEAYAVAIQGDGRIVAAGLASAPHFDFGLARYTCLRRTSRPMSIPLCP